MNIEMNIERIKTLIEIVDKRKSALPQLYVRNL